MRRTCTTMAACALLLAALAAPAAADSQTRPFRGTLSGSVAFVPFTPGCSNYGGFDLSSVGDATGHVLHLGKTHLASVHCTPDIGVTDITGGHLTFTAANGDAVHITYEGTAPFPDGQPVIVADIEFVITGGTGRFADAHGVGSMTAYITFEGFEDPEWAASWVIDGTIGY